MDLYDLTNQLRRIISELNDEEWDKDTGGVCGDTTMQNRQSSSH